ncbi:MAG TPA: class I SAM-dependent methyltransferase [Rhizomicrobium sp.]|nr:class I SAM-dependent methyltransferase [Rhizomicrobium sp.]
MSARASYGIDAPGVVRAHVVAGIVLAVVAAAHFAWPRTIPLAAWAGAGAALLAALLLFYAAVMLWSSLVSKKRLCDRLVTALALRGDERVLDAGCGRGLALIACAKKLTTGSAVGIDLWAAKDQSGNTPEATMANAVAEGVAGRVRIETGDITKLPFADASFDAIISMIVIHNIPSQAARDEALRELARALKPGGRMVIFDLMHTSRYAEVLRDAGLKVELLSRDLLWLVPCRSLLARKPG